MTVAHAFVMMIGHREEHSKRGGQRLEEEDVSAWISTPQTVLRCQLLAYGPLVCTNPCFLRSDLEQLHIGAQVQVRSSPRTWWPSSCMDQGNSTLPILLSPETVLMVVHLFFPLTFGSGEKIANDGKKNSAVLREVRDRKGRELHPSCHRRH
ncbi:hypothetical protein ARMSODRAFT_299521 [Armillaria solidipes]|uniref:Uncharacterized protein n=1 Tax=Armillaria solidipes TaxID=1076256 RepID=A0A2H3BA44_9AGAR|nr:hypothetical protein ARMSODRAFT_299521 [Armillaria solidipes]